MLRKSERFSFRGPLPKDSIRGNYFSLRFGKNKENKFACSVVVGQKISKKAVVRNREKRMLYHGLRKILGDRRPPFNLIFYLRGQILELNFQEIENEIRKALIQAKIIQHGNF